MNKILYVIPARSGSKGIKNKNIAEWNGKPLIMYSFQFLLDQQIPLDDICISTDSQNYINFFKKLGIHERCILKRPKCLGEDFVVDYPVVLHAWCIKEEFLQKEFDFITVIRPTSPNRPKDIITKGLKILIDNPHLTSVRAMRKVSEHPFRIWRFSSDKKYMKPLIEDVREPGNIPRQKLEDNYYFQSGEIEIIRRSTLQLGSISGSYVGIVEMTEKNIDIDTPDDIKY